MSASHPNSEHDGDGIRSASSPVLRPGVSEYADLRRAGYVYVDKTSELKRLLDAGKFLFLARPRRFGKTLMLSTVECMYQGDWPETRDPFVEVANPTPKVPDERLFAGTAWEARFAAAARRPVIRLDLSAVTGDDPAEMKQSLTRHVAQQARLWYGRGLDPGLETKYLRDAAGYPGVAQDMLALLIDSLKKQVDFPVVLVDEYDTPLLSLSVQDPVAVEPYFKVFREFFRVFKRCEGSLHKVLITGITRRAYGDLFSALNNLRDCTWRPAFAGVCGFTEAELDRTPLATCITVAAAELGQSPEELQEALRSHYNGYRFNRRGLGPAVYNPWSLCNTLLDLMDPDDREDIRRYGLPAYWSESGVSRILVDRLREHSSGMDSGLLQGRAELDINLFSNKSSDLKSLMLQSGYLTYLPASDRQPVRLGWPNREVATALLTDLAQAHVDGQLPGVARVRTCLETGVYTELPNALLDCLYAFPYNIMENESAFHAALHGLFLGMDILPLSERQELSGRYDLATICAGRACVIELKYNRSLQEAQDQAGRRQYGRSLLMELGHMADATCIALHLSRAKTGEIRIEGSQRPVQDVHAAWTPLRSEQG